MTALLSWRVATAKVALGSLALVGGFSAGREGPSVQVAASVLQLANRFLPNGRTLRPADLILAGGAAGIAAAFNTPLAGIVFAVEELGRRLESRTSGVLVSTIIISGLVAIALKGNYTYFGQLTVRDLGTAVWLPTLLSGVVCGIGGGLFSWLMLWPQRQPMFGLWVWRSAHPLWFAAGCGLVVAALGWVSGGTSFGSGYTAASQAIAGQITLEWHAPITRFLATLATYFSGIPGGIFAPSLAVGTAVGSDLSQWVGLGARRARVDRAVHGGVPRGRHAIADHRGDHRDGDGRRPPDGDQPDGGGVPVEDGQRALRAGAVPAARADLDAGDRAGSAARGPPDDGRDPRPPLTAARGRNLQRRAPQPGDPLRPGACAPHRRRNPSRRPAPSTTARTSTACAPWRCSRWSRSTRSRPRCPAASSASTCSS